MNMILHCKVIPALGKGDFQCETGQSLLVDAFKNELRKQQPWLPAEFKILFKGKTLKNTDSVDSYGINEGDKIVLMLPKDYKLPSKDSATPTLEESQSGSSSSGHNSKDKFYRHLHQVLHQHLQSEELTSQLVSEFKLQYERSLAKLSPDDIDRISAYQLSVR